MIITRHKHFRKNYHKRILPNSKLDQKFEERLTLFIQNHQNPILKDHELSGNLLGYRSFSITGDVRVVYKIVGENTIELFDIGSHNQVY